MKQNWAGITSAGIAEGMTAIGELFTVLDDTCHARVRFVAVNSPATGAG
jgi:hypothetical protein